MRALPAGVALAAAVAAFAPAAASGQTFRAACTDGLGDPGSLVTAITAANGAPGPDTVALGADCTYLLERSDNTWYGPNALPPIASDITIEGNGGAIARDPTAAHFRLFFVGADPTSPRTDNYVSPGAGTLVARRKIRRPRAARYAVLPMFAATPPPTVEAVGSLTRMVVMKSLILRLAHASQLVVVTARAIGPAGGTWHITQTLPVTRAG